MKRFWTVLVSAFALCLVLVGCGKEEGPGKAKFAEPFIGTWEITSMVEDGEETTAEDLALMKEFGLNVYLVLDEDGTGQLELFGDVMEGKWTADGEGAGTFTLSEEEGPVNMSLVEDGLVLERDTSTLNFKQIDPSQKMDAAEMSALFNNEDDEGTKYWGGNELDELDDLTEMDTLIADDDICTIKVIGKGSYIGDPAFFFEVVNKTDHDIYFASKEGSWTVNGKETEPTIMETIKAGETLGTIGWFAADEVGADVNTIGEVHGMIDVVDSDDIETVYGTYEVTL